LRQLPAKSKGTKMSNSEPKDKQNTDKQEKPVEPKPQTITPPVPERPQANVTRAQKSTGDIEDKSGNENNG
jgi:hypothetical protein